MGTDEFANTGLADTTGTRRIGDVIDSRYRITGFLGRGGMGSVYQAEHVTIRRRVAVKLLHPELSRNPEFNRRFEREAFATGRVEHPNCVMVSDFGKLGDGTLYLVMEYLDGISLDDLLAEESRLTTPRALHIMRHVLRGLRHAHRAGVVHRDLKPENIFLVRQDDDPDFAKILDFGIAKLVGVADTGEHEKLTRAGFAVGTPKYMAPELAFGSTVTEQADIYSASIVLFEMLTGRPPFVSEDPLGVLAMHAGKPVPAIREVAPEADVPGEVEALVQRGLEKKCERRIASADAYLHAIQDLLRRGVATAWPAPEQAQARTPAPVSPQPPQASTPMPASPQPPQRQTPAPVSPQPPQASTPVPAAAPSPRTRTPLPGAVPSRPGASPRPGSLPPADPRFPITTPAPTQMVWMRRPNRRRLGVIAAALAGFAVLVGVSASQCKSHGQLLTEYTQQLEHGHTCQDRKQAVEALRSLGDKRAIAPLKRARYRMRGGVLGIGDRNTNACLKDDADAAIDYLQSLPGR